MCSQYWNLDTEATCPECGKTAEWNFQSHDYGRLNSYVHHYKLNEPVQELWAVTGTLIHFCGECPKCGVFLDWAGDVEDGSVSSVYHPSPTEIREKYLRPEYRPVKGEKDDR